MDLPAAPASPAPRWDLTPFFAAFGDPAYLAFKAALSAGVDDLAAALAGPAAATEPARLAGWLGAYEGLAARAAHLGAYLGCIHAADTEHAAAQADEAWLSGLDARLTAVRARLVRALGALDEPAFATLLATPALAGAGHPLRRWRTQARHQLPGEGEALAADLGVDGLHAWGRLYTRLVGRMEFTLRRPDGAEERVPMSRRRALMADPDRALRLAAFRDGQVPWQEQRETLAAILNGIAGTRLTLARRRGWPDFLAEPYFDAGVQRETVDALFLALGEEVEVGRSALRLAARLEGVPALSFADLEAPHVPAPADTALDWDAAVATLRRAFGRSYPAFDQYLAEMLTRRAIEAEARSHKLPGAFCTSSQVTPLQRVYLTYHGTIHDVVTIAHEVGHAWHARLLEEARPFATGYPMTLAETASNFGERLFLSGLLHEPGLPAALRAHLLDQELGRATAYLLNIPARYTFERRFHEERAAGEVTADRLAALMVEAQRRWYGDTLAEGQEDPLFWASKQHFFITEVAFYNFPYVFGYLLGQALFERFRAEGPSFLPAYESFLRATGSHDCEDLARTTLGVDLRDPAFWRSAIATARAPLEALQAMKP